MLSPDGPVVATGTVDFVGRRTTAVTALPPHPDAPDPDSVTDVTMIIDGVDMYVEVIDRPGRWILNQLASNGDTVSAGDPGLLLDLLRGTVAASVVDDANLRDPAVTAFDVDIDIDRAMERAPDDLRRAIRETFDTLLRERSPNQARVHLDGDGRICHLDIAIPATDERPVERLEVALFDLGADIVIDLPDAASILDPEEMAELGAELAERFGDEYLTPPTGWDDGTDTSP